MVYSNLTDSAFKLYKEKLGLIEANIETFCIANGFWIERERFYNESLAINLYTKNDLEVQGNICLQAIDKKGDVNFTFGLTKTCDIGRYRYWRQKTILEQCSIESFATDANLLLTQAFVAYHAIQIEDLTSRTQLPPRY
jgi:hypothetical protein